MLHGSFGPLLSPYNSDDGGPTVLQLWEGMVVSDEMTKVYRATAYVESRSVNYVGLLVGSAVVRKWERELTEDQGRECGAGRSEKDKVKMLRRERR